MTGDAADDDRPAPPPAFVVHDAAQATAALTAAAEAGVPVTLASAPGAVAYLGARLFLEIVAAAHARVPNAACDVIVDCGGDAGHALSALRFGARHVSVDLPPAARARLAAFAAARGAVLADPPAGALDLRGVENPLQACRNRLLRARKAPISGPDPLAMAGRRM